MVKPQAGATDFTVEFKNFRKVVRVTDALGEPRARSNLIEPDWETGAAQRVARHVRP